MLKYFLVLAFVLTCAIYSVNAQAISIEEIVQKCQADADDMLENVVKPAFRKITDIVILQTKATLELPLNMKAIEESERKLMLEIAEYLKRLPDLYPASVSTHFLNVVLRDCGIEIREVIRKGLAELMNIRARLSPGTDLTPLIDIQSVLVRAAADFKPTEKTMSTWGPLQKIAPEKCFVKYCKHLENYVRTTAINGKVDRAVMKITRLIDGSRTLLEDPLLKRKYVEILGKVKSDFLNEIENLQINLCTFATADGDMHSVTALNAFIISEYETFYKSRVEVLFARFLQHMNIMMDAVEHTGLIIAFAVYDMLLKSDIYYSSWTEVKVTDHTSGHASVQWRPLDNLRPTYDIVFPMKAKLLKQFPTIFVDPKSTNRIVDSLEIGKVAHAIEYTMNQLKVKLRGKTPNTIEKLLDDFYLYLLWISIQDIIDHNEQPSFVNYRKYYLEEHDVM